MKAIILSGGSGSRLWPLSREEYPKQLLKLGEKYSLLQNTFLRLNKLINAQDILFVTNEKHVSGIKTQMKELGEEALILGEPLSRNTAPAILCSLEYFLQNGASPDETVLIVPADTLVKNPDLYIETVKEADEIAQMGYIVTFGIKPAYAETGYGYVKTLKPIKKGFVVDRFVEKPDKQTAENYLKQGNYYWNGGMFLSKLSVLKEEFRKHVPEISDMVAAFDLKSDCKIKCEEYEKLPSVSIDYAVMEKSDKVALIPLKSDWNDLGSWQSIYSEKEKDENGNVFLGSISANNVKNSLVVSNKRVVALSDMENIVLVETDDAIMLCDLNKTQNVKKLYEMLKENEVTKTHKNM